MNRNFGVSLIVFEVDLLLYHRVCLIEVIGKYIV
jgi:hypothetical protein